MVAARHLVGFKVLVVTIPPIGPIGFTTLEEADLYEARRLAYNQAVRGGDTGADGIVDWAADVRLRDPTNATYFYFGDYFHLEEAGNEVAAELARAAIEALS